MAEPRVVHFQSRKPPIFSLSLSLSFWGGVGVGGWGGAVEGGGGE